MELFAGLALFVAGSFIFWPALVISFLLITYAIHEEDMPVTLFFTTFIMGFLLFSKWGMGLSLSWTGISVAVIGYLASGTAWSFIKWFIKLRKIRNTFVAVRDDYLRDNGLPANYFKETVTTDGQKLHHGKFARALAKSKGFSKAYHCNTAQEALEKIKPEVSDSKGTIIMWIGYWPASVIAFILGDLLSEVFETIYASISQWFQKLSNRMFKDLV